MMLNPTPITQTNQDIGLHTMVPANFQAPVTISFWNNGNLPIDDNLNLSFNWYLLLSPKAKGELFLVENGYGEPWEALGITGRLAETVRVGSYTIRKSTLKA